jgi:hypothetical protein
LDAVYSQPDYPSAARGRSSGLSELRQIVSPAIEFLFLVRRSIGCQGRKNGYFLSGAAFGAETLPGGAPLAATGLSP